LLNDRTKRNGAAIHPSHAVVRYWGRKSREIAETYIRRYTKTGELVGDFFGGSGVFVRTALELGRRAVYIDLNPFAFLVAKSAAATCNPNEFLEAADQLISSLEVRLKLRETSLTVKGSELFQILCKCGKRVEVGSITYSRRYERVRRGRIRIHGIRASVLLHIPFGRTVTHQTLVAVNPEIATDVLSAAVDALIRDKLIVETEFPLDCRFVSACPCGRSGISYPRRLHWLIRGRIVPRDWYPKDKLQYSNGTTFLKQRDVTKISELFTNRNLAALASLWKSIKKVSEKRRVKTFLELAFMSALAGSSKMCRTTGGSWPVNSYWVPRTYVVRNPIAAFRRAVRRVFKMLLTQPTVKVGTLSRVIEGEAQAAFLRSDATNVKIPPNRLDYVIVDPPHSGEVQFFELSLFYTSWIRRKLEFSRELVINGRRNLLMSTYLRRVTQASRRVHDSLRLGGRYTVIFHSSVESLFRECANAVRSVGFDLEKDENDSDYRVLTFRKVKTHVATVSPCLYRKPPG